MRVWGMKCCCWVMQRRWDSWPPEEKNLIWGQRWGLITQSFCVISFIKGDNGDRERRKEIEKAFDIGKWSLKWRSHTVGGLMERTVWQASEANSKGKELVQLCGKWKMQLTRYLAKSVSNQSTENISLFLLAAYSKLWEEKFKKGLKKEPGFSGLEDPK